MTLQIFDFEQGSPEWHACRIGIPTASMFGAVKAGGDGKTRTTYMRKLAGEIICGEVMDGFTNAHMERGHAMEDDARSAYAFMFDQEPQRVGFMRRGNCGCSPDSRIGASGLLEIKTKLPHLHIEVLERKDKSLPPEHRPQVQGQLYVSELEFVDFVSYWPRMPLFVTRIYRDEDYIKNLAGEIDRFCDELAALVERVRNTQLPELKRAA